MCFGDKRIECDIGVPFVEFELFGKYKVYNNHLSQVLDCVCIFYKIPVNICQSVTKLLYEQKSVVKKWY
jgi:hypothetical protein